MVELKINKPYQTQIDFFKSTKKRIAFGGARGGGKSWALRTKCNLLCAKYPGIQILLLRRTFSELRENHIIPFLKSLKDIAKYKVQDKVFEFPNGSRIVLGYCKRNDDVLQYQGQAYDVICLDEATQFSEFQYQCLTESNRSSGICKVYFEPRMYFTCNPGGIGHEWVKRLFVDRQYINREQQDDYDFIKSSVYDNLFLLKNSPDYVRALENLPEQRKKAMLYGDWNVFEGQYFAEWSEEVHVCEPFAIPRHWRVYTTMDYGLDMLAHYYIALDEQGNAYVFHEIYKDKLIVSEAVDMILDIEKGLNVDVYERLVPPDLWNTQSSTGTSTAYLFADNGLQLTKSNNDRIDGWLATKEALKIVKGVDGLSTSKLKVFRSCTNLIRTLPALQFDEKRVNDVSNEPHELTHAPDAIRYFCIGWTVSADRIKSNKTEFNHNESKGNALGKRSKIHVI